MKYDYLISYSIYSIYSIHWLFLLWYFASRDSSMPKLSRIGWSSTCMLPPALDYSLVLDIVLTNRIPCDYMQAYTTCLYR